LSTSAAWSDRPLPLRPDGAVAGTAVRPGLLVLALALGVTTLSLLQSLVVPVLGTIEDQLDVSPGAAGWVLTANLLAAAVPLRGFRRGRLVRGGRAGRGPDPAPAARLAGQRVGLGSPAAVGCLAGSVLVLVGWVFLQRRTAQPLVRPGMLADRRTIVPNIAGLMTGIALFASFLAVLQLVQAPPGVTGYGFGASVLEASVVYLLPGGIAGIVVAPLTGRVLHRLGALPTLLAGTASGVAGFLLPAFPHGEPWLVVIAGCSFNCRSRSPTWRSRHWSCRPYTRTRPAWPTR
jgi:hypothetical protein